MFKPSKVYFQDELIKKIKASSTGTKIRILELGCGRAEVTAEILKACPQVEYIGIEPYQPSFESAKKNLAAFPNALALNGFGYGDVVHSDLQTPFDIVYSLSVLEHVKDLPKFLKYASDRAKPGADIIHLYDLGHSLYPGGWKETFQTKLCNTPLLRFVPEHKVARYLSTESVQHKLEQTGCHIERVTFHNMVSHLALLKAIPDNPTVMQSILQLEEQGSALVTNTKQKEKLFPSVCMWGRKM